MSEEFDTPKSRVEAILQNMLGAENVLPPPQSRIEYYLQKILEEGISSLPDVTAADNGKVLGVVDGEWNVTEDSFICTFTKSGNNIICDKTRTEILEAYDAGKTIYGKANLHSMFSTQLLGIGIFKLENIDETNNRHIKFVCNAIVPYSSEQGEVTLAKPSILYLNGTTVLNYYYWSVFTVPIPPVPTENQAGKAYSVDDYGVAGWGSKAVPIPDDVSVNSRFMRTLRAEPFGNIYWHDETIVAYAWQIIDDTEDYTLNDCLLLAIQNFIASAIVNPGTFTVSNTPIEFSSSMTFDDNIAFPVSMGVNFAIAFVLGANTLIAKPNYCTFNNNDFNVIGFHFAGSFPIQSGSVNLNVDAIISSNQIDISGFAD